MRQASYQFCRQAWDGYKIDISSIDTPLPGKTIFKCTSSIPQISFSGKFMAYLALIKERRCATPRLYLSPNERLEMPIGVGLASSISALGTNVIDKLLSRASVRCDSECKRRLQAPGSTTLSQPASPGATQISVSSTLTLDELDEQAVQIGTGSTQETILIKPGGVTVTNWAS